MPDYKAMYLELFRASVQAVELLQAAQARAEQQYLDAAPPPLRLEERPQKPSPSGKDSSRSGRDVAKATEWETGGA